MMLNIHSDSVSLSALVDWMGHYCQNWEQSLKKMDQMIHNDKNGWKDKKPGDDEDRKFDWFYQRTMKCVNSTVKDVC